ncbi:gonadotropin-releasing hormone II receptor isoform X1 [Pogonomyrmex barbatus]|uniref:Gonadotropin-releasing hormone II receptor isoform X1 n=1 Tax=Pogonomyrmex barbatus TaxID=144034 RepID=A0A6I9W6V5_9HYME|nr:gonadotropin-releasing hormone II receptor isoform X1 [Pogonomyrmex barbatus]XP_011637382.1 gonadotropin-releasing hormone II receptor isoform X1 [Pogonomyrmex barbatus]XP_011637383.1 gonadotropin-releasing hormone II receptor isoform X1 [Pogonomyrmex barbatus]XP_025074120.1 gonadotropin-releasing hormone II receptor isoform X1 [Pogonomyrmex barbatus]XP_025074121.1 gonadotropin-releasing hormone II receptor isoform X1 [Pogonomyrmex barbatus]
MINNLILDDMGNVMQLDKTQDGENLKCNDTELPIDMRFNDGHIVTIVTYSILMVISAAGNISVLIMTIIKKRKSKSRIQNLVMHLSIADLFVTFLMMPLEIGWASTVSWEAGDAMCRIMAFFRIFGLYLSSYIIICISIDRYYAVMRPLQILDDRRGKILLILAWIGSILCSMPQMLVFSLEKHPNHTCYTQCVTFNTFPSYMHQVSYSLFGMVTMYWFPLIVIFYTYTSIFLEICRRSKERIEDKIRRSSNGFLSRARVRTLKMTITIIAVFIICWSPYYVMSVWYWIDRPSALKVDLRIQRALFFFACTNSSMNPIIYGIFNIRQRNKAKLQSHPLLKPNTTMELPVVAYARDSIFTIFVIALPVLFNPPTLYNRRPSHDRNDNSLS